MAKTIQKMLSLSPEMYRMIVYRAHTLGLSFTEYIRHVLANDVRKIVDTDGPTYDTDAINTAVHDALGEANKPETKKIKTKQELDAYIKEIEDSTA